MRLVNEVLGVGQMEVGDFGEGASQVVLKNIYGLKPL
jgi:hypothetical protein